MRRRTTKKPSLLSPAGNLLKRLSDTSARQRRRMLKWTSWVLGLAFAYSLMIGNYGIPRIVKLEMQRNALLEANRKQVVDIVDARRMRDMLKSDSRYIELIARTRYYMTRPNETVYRYRGR